jgi:hypothetical protein
MIEAIVINRLLRWARWKMQTGNALGYPGQVSFLRLVPSATYFPDPGIDAECVLTERAYEMLPVVHKAVLWVEYLSTKINAGDKAHSFGRSIRRYRECVAEAHVVMGNTIDMLQDKRQEEVA